MEGGRFPNSLILSWDRPGGRPWGMKLGPMHGRLSTDLILILRQAQDVEGRVWDPAPVLCIGRGSQSTSFDILSLPKDQDEGS